MSRLLPVFACTMMLSLATLPAFAQATVSKPKTPGEMAAVDKDTTERRAACEREARAQKLSYMKRRQFVRGCLRR